ncbi:hypothetical protein G6O69_00810 [Pseudenhygromyxa sp. WMMC2535]|uniref:hypothetical protein n=1 Tax=Pseudenhygromyxa sp. WMMC2535 TaxID=2712867 RepID=UPI001557F295|nr:hypothetical protein [Pseudenhygromyxa sp. WMMC2535]NVB36350.1 hypothetical protein [Pseudenhygromyxa sp. WMMC2535]
MKSLACPRALHLILPFTLPLLACNQYNPNFDGDGSGDGSEEASADEVGGSADEVGSADGSTTNGEGGTADGGSSTADGGTADDGTSTADGGTADTDSESGVELCYPDLEETLHPVYGIADDLADGCPSGDPFFVTYSGTSDDFWKVRHCTGIGCDDCSGEHPLGAVNISVPDYATSNEGTCYIVEFNEYIGEYDGMCAYNSLSVKFFDIEPQIAPPKFAVGRGNADFPEGTAKDGYVSDWQSIEPLQEDICPCDQLGSGSNCCADGPGIKTFSVLDVNSVEVTPKVPTQVTFQSIEQDTYDFEFLITQAQDGQLCDDVEDISWFMYYTGD